MKKTVLVVAVLLVVVALSVATGYLLSSNAHASFAATGGVASSDVASSVSNGDSQNGGIWVTGTGIVTVVPDVAVLSLGVEARESTVEEAMDEAADAMDAVMAKLRAKGVADKDIKTEWFSIYPITEWIDYEYSTRGWIEDGHEVIVGYRVSNTVSVKIRDVDAAGEIIDAAAQAGGDLIRVQGVSFTVDDPSLYYVEARQEAMTDAKAKAQQLASLAGVGLGKAYYISESSGYYPIYADYAWESRGGDVAATTQISPGEMDITLSVQVAFAIQ